MNLVIHDIFIDPLLRADIEGRTVMKVRLLPSWSLHSSVYDKQQMDKE